MVCESATSIPVGCMLLTATHQYSINAKYLELNEAGYNVLGGMGEGDEKQSFFSAVSLREVSQA